MILNSNFISMILGKLLKFLMLANVFLPGTYYRSCYDCQVIEKLIKSGK